MSFLIVCVLLIVVSLRTRADVVNEKDFTLGKEEQMSKAHKLLAADSIDAAFVLLNMVVGDVEAKKKISHTEAEAIADAYLMLGEIHSGQKYGAYSKYNDYGKAYSSYKKAVEISERYELKSRLAKALLGLAVKYEVQLSSYPDPVLTDTLLLTLKRSVVLSAESESWETLDMAMKNLASEAFSRGREKEIADELKNYYTIPLSKGNQNHNREFIKAFCQAMQAFADDDIEDALRHTETMEKYAVNMPVRKIDTYSMRAEILFSKRLLKEVMVCMDSVSSAAREVKEPWYDMQIEHSKSKLYAAMGRKADSDSCLFRYYDLRERLFEDRSASRIKDLYFLDRIDSVTLQMQKITLERQHVRTLLIIAVVVVIVFGIMLILLVRTNRNLRESKKRIFEEYSRKLKEEEKPAGAVKVNTYPVADDESSVDIEREEDEKYKSSLLTEEQKDEVLIKIKSVLSKSEAALSSRYQIKDLATEAGENARNISQVINERCGCNFATFLAEHRINTACRRISESASYRKLTIEAMAASVGIQSRSYFSTTFKKIVGLNPSDYIRQAEKESGQKQENDAK
ncbi:MAG: AraC family transcriptional regulator [Bacteroides sp.]|nr:AraC family transcriptional regulator [Bacteroides sp.]